MSLHDSSHAAVVYVYALPSFHRSRRASPPDPVMSLGQPMTLHGPSLGPVDTLHALGTFLDILWPSIVVMVLSTAALGK